MKEVPDIKLFTPIEWFIIAVVLLGMVGYFAYPTLYSAIQAAVSEELHHELATIKPILANTESELSKVKDKLADSEKELADLKGKPVPTDNSGELTDAKKNLAIAQDEIKRLEGIIKNPPDEDVPDDKLQKKVWDWEDYAKKASAYQDYLEGKEGSPKVERPIFPYTLL